MKMNRKNRQVLSVAGKAPPSVHALLHSLYVCRPEIELNSFILGKIITLACLLLIHFGHNGCLLDLLGVFMLMFPQFFN